MFGSTAWAKFSAFAERPRSWRLLGDYAGRVRLATAIAVALLAAAGLLFDAVTPKMLSVDLFYVPIVLAGFWFSNRNAAIALALVSTPLIIIGNLITAPDQVPEWEAWTNRLITIGTVWLTAVFVVYIRDLEHKLQQQIEIANALSREISHRVANSLQLVASSLRSQAASTRSEDARQVLEIADARIIVIGRIQRMLSNAGPDEPVDASPFITELVGDLRSTLSDPDKVSITVRADSAALTSSTATPLGALMVEIINNSLKHAFPEGMEGAIAVRFTADKDQYILEVEDDGVGIDATWSAEGLGTHNVAELARLMNGSLTCQHARTSAARPGTLWRLATPRD
jgi:two-component sensor histidine kinase